MAVESRFVVIRQGVEVETFMDKKAADEYDKMLDMADNLAEMLNQVPVKLTDADKEELSVYLAKHREDVLIALQAKKPKAAQKAPTKKEKSAATKVTADKKAQSTDEAA
ncbi:YebG family protein [Thalassotalea sp. 1_MG-2023]|uniref:YebG family protein n=1 Tax=Thalassotalea sp. 1_MG-2023 TaxID=3062680 RepID=UPI0026E1DD5B|nr:YebG family protein [Thalassotalea sp. 1_MG-2023]MDO6427470.1 YebG family protein [Thalassotalea sp. 1_MG-2023]